MPPSEDASPAVTVAVVHKALDSQGTEPLAKDRAALNGAEEVKPQAIADATEQPTRYKLSRLEIFEALVEREKSEAARARQDELMRRMTEEVEKEGIGMEGISDNCKLRFLVDRQMDPHAAAQQYVAHRRWRPQYCTQGKHVQAAELPYFQQSDYGCFQWVPGKVPLIVLRARLQDTNRCSSQDIARFCVYAFDRALACCPPGFQQFNIILDLWQANFKQLDTRASLLMAEIIQRSYPERIQCLYIIRVPALFWPAWGIVSRFIRKEVREKIIIVHDKDMQQTLTTYIQQEVLPAVYGGKAAFTNALEATRSVSNLPNPLE